MAYYLVELYLPRTGPGGIEGVTARARSVAARTLEAGDGVRHVRSIFVPEDEICFELYEGPSAEAVRRAVEARRPRLARIVEAVDVAADNEGSAAGTG